MYVYVCFRYKPQIIYMYIYTSKYHGHLKGGACDVVGLRRVRLFWITSPRHEDSVPFLVECLIVYVF